MRHHLFLLIILASFSINLQAQKLYVEEFEAIDSMVRHQLPQSAQRATTALKAQLTLDSLNPFLEQLEVKVYLYELAHYQALTEENATILTIQKLERELAGFTPVQQAILNSYLADLYQEQFSRIYYKIQDQAVIQPLPQKLKDWTVPQFRKKILELQLESIAKPELLSVSALDFSLLLSDVRKAIKFRKRVPTLYDLLVYKAIAQFKEFRNAIAYENPIELFENADLLKNAATFIQLELPKANDLNPSYLLVHTLQEVLKFHKKQQNDTAFAYANLQRLELMLYYSRHDQKEQLYTQTLEKLKNKKGPLVEEAFWQLIFERYEQAKGNYQYFDVLQENQFALVEVYKQCKELIEEYPNSKQADRAKTLMKTIKYKEFKVQNEQIYLPNQAILMELEYRNVDKIYYKILPISSELLQARFDLDTANQYRYRAKNELAYWNFYLKQATAIEPQQITLPQLQDYQTHVTEFALPALSTGKYVILYSDQPEFEYDSATTLIQTLKVNNLTASFLKVDQVLELRLLNRSSGEPIKNWILKSKKKKIYDHACRCQRYEKVKIRKPNKEGVLTLESNIAFNGLQFEFIAGQDSIEEHWYQYSDRYRSKYKESIKIQVFTDRAIYRPGQNIYFKVVLLDRKKEDEYAVIPNKEIIVDFLDEDYTLVDSITLTTNDFGSVQGSFKAPSSKLGEYLIRERDHTTRAKFRIEEYKRPKFKVELGDMNDYAVLGDSVHIKGRVKLYSGGPAGHLPVKYNIEVSYSEQITGEVLSRSDGSFTISFLSTYEEEFVPYYYEKGKDYRVQATVTDFTGETHSDRKTYYLSKEPYEIHFKGSSNQFFKKLNLSISTKNLNNRFLPSTLTYEIKQLPKPEWKKNRSWYGLPPDLFIFRSEEFDSLFPYYASFQVSTATNDRIVKKGRYKLTENQQAFQLPHNLPVGLYEISVKTTTQNGDSISHSMRFSVHHHKSPKTTTDKLLFAYSSTQVAETGDNITIYLETAVKKPLQVLMVLRYKNEIIRKEWHELDQKKQIQLKFKKEYIGAISCHFTTVFQGCAIEVPVSIFRSYKDKQLQLQVENFRDRMAPGAKDSWILKVKGQGKKQAYELLAALYDASLDELTSHQWNYWNYNINNIYSNSIFEYFGALAQSDRASSKPSKGLSRSEYNYTSSTPPVFHNFNYDLGYYGRRYHWFFDHSAVFYMGVLFEGYTDLSTMRFVDTLTNKSYSLNDLGKIKIKPVPGSTRKRGELNLDGMGITTSPIDITEMAAGVNRLDRVERKSSNTVYVDGIRVIGAASIQEHDLDSEKGNISEEIYEKRTIYFDGEELHDYAGFYKGSINLNYHKEYNIKTLGVPANYGAPNNGIDKDEIPDFSGISIRRNLSETVFFKPQLRTNRKGEVLLEFEMNEALTRWRLMLLAHSKDAKVGYTERYLSTQKPLMIQPNPPRFFRQGDTLHFTAKVLNLSPKEQSGQATLQLIDPETEQPLDSLFEHLDALREVKLEAKNAMGLSWKLIIPTSYTGLIHYRVLVKTEEFSDGEQDGLPVLPNRLLVTESMPLQIRGGERKKVEFERMQELSKSNSLQQHRFTLEFTQNPAWLALQSLPYLMEFPHECSEQLFSRFFANAIATQILNNHPKIKAVFDQWREQGQAPALAQLDNLPELKSSLLEETPWVFEARTQAEQQQRLAQLFDLARMRAELDGVINKLAERQNSDDYGFSWFSGGPSSRFISQHIAVGLGQLQKMGVDSTILTPKVQSIYQKALEHCELNMLQDYSKLLFHVQQKGDSAAYFQKDHLNRGLVQYLYARSFTKQDLAYQKSLPIYNYYMQQATKYWMNQPQYLQGMIALILYRARPCNTTTKLILQSLKERAFQSEEKGAYWKYEHGYYWHQAPVETQALMIELFDELGDTAFVEELKLWLLRQKRSNSWSSTKSTTLACYALLSSGQDWLMDSQPLKIKLAGKSIEQPERVEAGTGYFTKSWSGEEIAPELAQLEVENPNRTPAWGAAYWQYFEQLDKITSFEDTPLSVQKRLFKEVETDSGTTLLLVEDTLSLQPGDLLQVQLKITATQDMEFVHLKDQRAAGLEPMNVLSKYKYQGGLSYYESTRDAASHFFIEQLPKGEYILEYPLRVNHKGQFSNGISTIQSMYAPEFSSHSAGTRIEISKE